MDRSPAPPPLPADELLASRLEPLLRRERDAFRSQRPLSSGEHERALAHWLNGVPMHWMADWQLPFPLVVRSASGATLTDIDGHTYADFCLGDTGAMFGHSPAPVANAVQRQVQSGLTYMLPTRATGDVGQLLAERFGLPLWQITQTATDANRAVVRWARAIAGRDKVLVMDGCYHGTVDDVMVELSGDSTSAHGSVVPRAGQIGRVHDVSRHARVVEFNDLPALERELERGDVACVLAEPVMTNAGMVLPLPGYWEAARELCSRHSTLLAIDETHTLSSGPGGHARRIGLSADFLVCGKAIAGGVPCAVYGFTERVGAQMQRVLETKPQGHSGLGTTLAANALATSALAACLGEVMTHAAYAHMTATAERLHSGLQRIVERHALPWHCVAVGARVELVFTAAPVRTARESAAAARHTLERALHLYLLNRGTLITPFHNMMLASPATSAAQVDALLAGIEGFCAELVADRILDAR